MSMEIKLTRKYKSIALGANFQFPEFCILTGKNGSGKSHLLEAMAATEYTELKTSNGILNKIKYIPFNGLNPSIAIDFDPQSLTTLTRQLWSQISDFQNQAKMHIQNGHSVETFNNEWFLNQFGNTNYRRAIMPLFDKSKKDFKLITESDVFNFADLTVIYSDDLFVSQFAMVFKAYHVRLEENMYAEYKNIHKNQNNKVLSDSEFLAIYGPPPWELINGILENAGLPYRVNNPLNQKKEDLFRLIMFDPTTKFEVSINDLSTGEKVLMSLALAIYNSSHGGLKLDLLLLDEPDAALHPEFSKLLIETLDRYIVKTARVRVVLTTHSPSTVACSLGIPIFEMDKHQRVPVLSSITSAVKSLTEGLPLLRISSDPRRQIFVESKYDVIYFEKFLQNIRRYIQSKIDFQFLPPRSSLGSNCDDVKSIVNELSKLGNDLVYGIIDYDNKNQSTGRIIVLGDGKRYSVENYVLDPLYVGLLLIREKILSLDSIGLPPLSYVDLKQLEQIEWQKVINFVVESLGFSVGDDHSCETISGCSFLVPLDFFNCNGHLLEEKILNKWPPLNKVKRGRTEDNIFKEYIFDSVISDYPGFISKDLIETFEKIV
jgi:ABC-type lipoprotein export system ATPase subunit